MYVVSSHETNNGIGGTSSMSYRYEGLKVTLDGRGFCGFRKMTATDDQTGIRTATFYRQDHPYKSMAFKKEVRLSDGTLLSRSEDIWSVTNFTHGGYFPHVTQSISEDYEIDGTLITTATTTKSFDGFGNTLQIDINHSDGHTETTVNTFTNDTTNWFLGRLTQAEVTKQAPGQSPLTRTSSFAYNPTTGILTEETIEPNHPTLSSTKTYVHDGFGNILSSTVAPFNVTPTTQTTTYDARGQFEVTSVNTFGHSETRAYDVRHGTVTSLTGPNGFNNHVEL